MSNTLPASNSFADFGGAKTDYSSVVNSSTDWSADNINTAHAAVAGMSRTVARGSVRFTTAATSGAMSLNAWETTWKADTATAPVLARSGTGTFTVSLPSTVSDPLGNTINVNLRSAQVTIEGSLFVGVAQYTITAANVITIYTANTSFVANDVVGTIISVSFT